MRSRFLSIAICAAVLSTVQVVAGQINSQLPTFYVASNFTSDAFGGDFGCVVGFQRILHPVDCQHEGGELDPVYLATHAVSGSGSEHESVASRTVCHQEEILEVTVQDYKNELGAPFPTAMLSTTLVGPIVLEKGHVYAKGAMKKSAVGKLRDAEINFFAELYQSHPRCDQSQPDQHQTSTTDALPRQPATDGDLGVKQVTGANPLPSAVPGASSQSPIR